MDTPIVIIILAYIASFTFLGVQSVVGDPMGIEMKVYQSDLGGFGDQDPTGCYNSAGGVVGGILTPTYTTEYTCQLSGNEWHVSSDSLRTSINTISDTFAGCYDNNNSLIGGFGNQTYVDEDSCNTASGNSSNPNTPYQWISGTNSTFSNLSYQTAQMQLTMANQQSVTNDPILNAASLVYLIFQVMTGTYVFNLLAYLGIPLIFVAGVSMIYIILISIWTIMLLRGNNIN